MIKHPKEDRRSAEEITSSAGSNLAFALRLLPAEKRKDLVTFYAFCRVVDDLADELDLPLAVKREGFRYWKMLFSEHEVQSESLEGLRRDILDLRERHQIPRALFLELLTGCEGDLEPQRFQSWKDLQTYTYRVASVVGLICLPLFGASKAANEYAVSLGHALQITNIIRDVGEDLEEGGRIYVPLKEAMSVHYLENDFQKKVYDERFLKLMRAQAQRAWSFYQQAETSYQALSKVDQKALRAAQTMGAIYSSLLKKMEQDHFQVFTKRYRLGRLQKLYLLVKNGLR